jgi:peptidyl-prolyl cis-trans isomerase SurA
VSKAKPDTGFTLPVQQVGGVIVGFVAGTVYPSFEEERAALEKEAADAANNAAGQLLADFQKSLHVTINPRYGVLKNGQLSPADGGVVRLLDQAAATTAPGTGGK